MHPNKRDGRLLIPHIPSYIMCPAYSDQTCSPKTMLSFDLLVPSFPTFRSKSCIHHQSWAGSNEWMIAASLNANWKINIDLYASTCQSSKVMVLSHSGCPQKACLAGACEDFFPLTFSLVLCRFRPRCRARQPPISLENLQRHSWPRLRNESWWVDSNPYGIPFY